MKSNRIGSALILPGIALAIVVAVIGYVAFASNALPDRPTDLVWDRTACDACQMHVGEPGFAAQVQLRDGRTLAYDDPGCLLDAWQATTAGAHAVWFHHLHEARWLRSDQVAFVRVEPTPMGFGLGAVDPGTPGSMTLEAARALIATAAGGHR